MKQTNFLIAFLLCTVQLFAQGAPKKWTWIELNFAPCKGVGLNATASFEVTAELFDTKEQGKLLLKNLKLRAKTGVSKVHYSGSIVVTKAGGKKETYLLEEPRYVRWESAEGPKVVLVVPQKNSEKPKESIGEITLSGDCSVQVIVTMVADLSGGACVLGTTKHNLELN